MKRCVIYKLLIIFFVFAILIIPNILAEDVAYIMKNPRRIDQNIINSFNDLNFSVDLINDKDVPRTDFSKYRIIFISDERVKNAARKVDITKHKIIIMNYYYGDEFGLTDRDGIANFVASSPLKVLIENSIVPVYTVARLNGKYLSYYYLPLNNKIKGFKQIASPYRGNGHDGLGDVISYANEGDVLENGKTVKENMCFFGIAKTQYWTPQAKNLFKDCIDFVAVECSSNAECDDGNNHTQDICVNPGMRDSNCVHTPIICNNELECGVDGFTGQNFCSNKDVVRSYLNYTCLNPGTTNSSCNVESSDKLIEQCSLSCTNGVCNAPVVT
ncbi:MAG: hypothetical protein AABY22_26940, partial [Nanoarchaeota archaeon]